MPFHFYKNGFVNVSEDANVEQRNVLPLEMEIIKENNSSTV